MDMFLLLLLVVLSIPALGIAGFVLAVRQRKTLAMLQSEVGRLANRMQVLESGAAGAPPEAILPEPVPVPEMAVDPVPAPEPALAPEMPVSVTPPVAAPVAAKASLEERLASRWFVWLGAVALSLAGLFLILYAVEHGWLGPTARVTLGLLLGAALAGAGEW